VSGVRCQKLESKIQEREDRDQHSTGFPAAGGPEADSGMTEIAVGRMVSAKRVHPTTGHDL